MPADEYQLRYNDSGGQILPLLWLGGCVLCVWFALGATVVVAVVEWNLLLGLGVGLGGALLGILASSFLAGGFLQLDARYLRLGPLAAVIEFLTLFAGAIVVVLVGAWALGAFGSEAAGTLPAITEALPATAGSVPEPKDLDPFDVLIGAARALSLLACASAVIGFLLKPDRSR